MKSRLFVQGLVVTAVITVFLWAADARRARAQEGCPSGMVCTSMPCGFVDGLTTLLQETEPDCTTETAPFTQTMDTWTYLFDDNNAIKIGTDVNCPFDLTVDRIRISQAGYAARRDSEFADTVCNPSFDGVDCVFYRVHGETVPRACYGATVDYRVFWNNPPIQGNKHDWMLLRAPCDEFTGDTDHLPCSFDPPFTENITDFVDRKPPVGTDPVVGGDADGMSDYIVAISRMCPESCGKSKMA